MEIQMDPTYIDEETLEYKSRFLDGALELQQMLLPINSYEKMPLVSLEEATEPLRHLLYDVSRMAHKAKQSCNDPSDGLSCDESASIYLYSMEWEPYEKCLYYVLNATLRNGDQQKLKPWFLYLKLILTALGLLPSFRSFIYRGATTDVGSQYSEGTKFVWSAFSSCTASIRDIERFLGQKKQRTVFVIECTTGKDIQKHSCCPSRRQVLLPPARCFTVISCFNPENDVCYVRLGELNLTTLLVQSNVINPIISLFPTRGAFLFLPAFTFAPLLIHQISHMVVTLVSNYYSSHRNSLLEKEIDKSDSHSGVNLTKHNLVDGDMEIVVKQAITRKQYKELWLNNNQITVIGASILADALRTNSTLESLFLSYNRMADDGVLFFAQNLSFNKSILKVLRLQCNAITDDGTRYLAGMLKKNTTLKELWLSNNEIGDEGVKALADALAYHNTSLTYLSLDANKSISDRSIHSIINMLTYSPSLEKLNIRNCQLSEAGTERLRLISRFSQMEFVEKDQQRFEQLRISDPSSVVKTEDNDQWIYPALLFHFSFDSRLYLILHEIADHHLIFTDSIDFCIMHTRKNKNITSLIIEIESLDKYQQNCLISEISAIDHVESIYLLGKPPEKDEERSEFFTQFRKVCMFCENEEQLALGWALKTSADCRTLGDHHIKSDEADLARKQYERGIVLYKNFANFIERNGKKLDL